MTLLLAVFNSFNRASTPDLFMKGGEKIGYTRN
jgi:hypothetical protein